MKLLIVTQKVDLDDENLGFFHSWLLELAKHFEEITVLALRVGETDLPANVKVWSFGRDRRIKNNLAGFWQRMRRIYNFWELFSLHYSFSEAVFFHMIPEFVLAAAPFLIFKKKFICLWYTHKSVTHKLHLAEKFVDFIFTASELSFRLPSKKVVYTGHAVDTELFKTSASAGRNKLLKLVTVGRVSPVKDYDTMVRACSILKRDSAIDFVFSIVGGPIMAGDDKYLDSLKELVVKLDLEKEIKFMGPRPYRQIPSIYAEQDLFLSMSATGSIDKSVLEAMASGLSVITANEAFRDILPPKYFLDKRSPEALAAKIKELSQDIRPNEYLRDLVIKHHSLSRTLQKISEIIRNKGTRQDVY